MINIPQTLVQRGLDPDSIGNLDPVQISTEILAWIRIRMKQIRIRNFVYTAGTSIIK